MTTHSKFCMNVDEFKKLPRKTYNPTDDHTTHDGQLKLLLSEIFFLTRLLEQDVMKDNPIVLYIGSSPGHHIPKLIKLFPEFEYHLYDSRKSCVKQSDRVKVFEKIFDESLIEEYNEMNRRIILISDIRSVSVKEDPKGILIHKRDNQLQKKIFNSLCNGGDALLKFRLPFDSKERLYLTGEVILQPYAGPYSTEVRLIPSEEDEELWCARKYEEIMFYHNCVVRPKGFDKEATNSILQRYVTYRRSVSTEDDAVESVSSLKEQILNNLFSIRFDMKHVVEILGPLLGKSKIYTSGVEYPGKRNNECEFSSLVGTNNTLIIRPKCFDGDQTNPSADEQTLCDVRYKGVPLEELPSVLKSRAKILCLILPCGYRLDNENEYSQVIRFKNHTLFIYEFSRITRLVNQSREGRRVYYFLHEIESKIGKEEKEEFFIKLKEILSRFFPHSTVNQLLRGKQKNVWLAAFTTRKLDKTSNYELLELLGDRALESAFPFYLIQRFRQLTEDEITKMKSYFLSKTQQANFSSDIGLPELIFKKDNEELSESLREDLFEAFFGALRVCGENISQSVGPMLVDTLVRKLYDPINLRKIEVNSITELKELCETLIVKYDPGREIEFLTKHARTLVKSLPFDERIKFIALFEAKVFAKPYKPKFDTYNHHFNLPGDYLIEDLKAIESKIKENEGLVYFKDVFTMFLRQLRFLIKNVSNIIKTYHKNIDSYRDDNSRANFILNCFKKILSNKGCPGLKCFVDTLKFWRAFFSERDSGSEYLSVLKYMKQKDIVLIKMKKFEDRNCPIHGIKKDGTVILLEREEVIIPMQQRLREAQAKLK